jgi:hypothetical protein
MTILPSNVAITAAIVDTNFFVDSRVQIFLSVHLQRCDVAVTYPTFHIDGISFKPCPCAMFAYVIADATKGTN